MKTMISRGIAAVLCMLTLLQAVPVKAAQTNLNVDQEVRLTIAYADGGKGLPGVKFDLYQVAKTDAATNMTVVEAFQKYPLKLTQLTQEQWQDMALTLAGYAQRDGLASLYSGVTNEAGKVVFPEEGKSLKPGLYLVTGAVLEQEDFIYKVSPFMVFLPSSPDEKHTWNYDVTVKPKFERIEVEKVSCKVLKIWEDKGNESKRPKEITVQLLCDGKEYDTVKLTEKGSWRHTWEKLSAKNSWTVVEKEISGYTVKTAKEGVTYTITNTYEKPETPGSTKKPTKVPQTGMLWWPVPILAICGLLFLMLGMFRKKRSDQKD